MYAQHFEEHLPEAITGTDFLKKYHHHYDHATQVSHALLNHNYCLMPMPLIDSCCKLGVIGPKSDCTACRFYDRVIVITVIMMITISE